MSLFIHWSKAGFHPAINYTERIRASTGGVLKSLTSPTGRLDFGCKSLRKPLAGKVEDPPQIALDKEVMGDWAERHSVIDDVADHRAVACNFDNVVMAPKSVRV